MQANCTNTGLPGSSVDDLWHLPDKLYMELEIAQSPAMCSILDSACAQPVRT